MHIKHIHTEIVSCEAQTFKHLQMTYHIRDKARTAAVRWKTAK